MSQVESLKKALEDLSEKRHVLSKEATYAKEHLATAGQTPTPADLAQKQADIVAAFTESVALLAAIFSRSRFDQVLAFAAHPLRLLSVHFFIAFFRGVGFMVGALAVVFLVAMWLDMPVLPAL